MNMIQKITKDSSINIESFVNEETGEALLSEIKSSKKIITVKEDTGLVKIVRPEGSYGTFSSDSIKTLINVLNNSDLGNVIKMSVDIKTSLNIVYNNNIPHSNETLQAYLGIKSQSKFHELIRRLIKAGVVYKLEGLIQGEVRKTILINPFLFTKRATFDQKVIDVFSKFSISNAKK